MKNLYGEFTSEQINETVVSLRKRIFFLLLYVDKNTKDNYSHVNVEDAFDGILRELGGLNELLYSPIQIVKVMSLLQGALIEYRNPQFSFSKYRKMILDAGSEIEKIKEV